MDIFENRDFEKTINDNLEIIPLEARRDFSNVKSNFSFKDIYILGGFVRDSILKFIYCYNFPINDLDILINNTEFSEFAKEYPGENLSRFGGLKFKYSNFSMDVFSIDNIFFLKDNPELDKNLENVLIGCDLSTSAFAYNLESKKIYSVKAMEDVLKREINVNNHSYMEPAPTISRLILHSDKMNFNIGESGIKYIRENYSPELDKDISKFLKYKEVEHMFPLIKKNIKEII